jgi:RNA polymerase sigma-70 factor, ECF subfamily
MNFRSRRCQLIDGDYGRGDRHEEDRRCEDVPVSDATLTNARAGDEQAFSELTDRYRRELQLHCYRLLGSIQDAEDAVQETLVSAWRGLDRYQERASVRSWLYAIATNRCLNMRRDSARRPRTELPFEPPAPTRMSELTWLEPYPDALIEALPDDLPGPAARYETREAVGLAFITALQRLPARQRGALVLRDVLGFRAGEAAEMLGTSEATVNSALQRARAALQERLPVPRDRVPAPGSRGERELADTFADAFERGELDRVVELLSDDAWVKMPPEPYEYQGRAAISNFFEHVTRRLRGAGSVRLVATRANGQPAFGHYLLEGDELVGRGLLVLTIEGEQISELIRFGGGELLARFGLPATLPP